MALMFLRKKGMRVLAQGYNVIPIKPGFKFPTIDDFLTVPTTPKRITGWLANGHARAGLGITSKYTPCVDIDTYNLACARHMQQFVFDCVGEGMVRIGQPPKRGIIFRTSKPFPKISSRIFTDNMGRKAQIEILCDGQQFVAFHEHPDTKKPYFWVGAHTPENTPHDNLPEFTEADGRAIVAEFEKYAEETGGWRPAGNLVVRPATREPDELDDLNLGTDQIGMSIEELHERVMAIPNDDADYDTWLKIGMAIWHETQGSEDGKDLWDEWSAQSTKSEDTRFNKSWRSFGKRDDTRRPVTARYIIQLTPEYTAKKSAKEAYKLVAEFGNAQNTAELSQISLECKKIQFLPIDFALVVGALKTAFKRISGQTLTPSEARKMVAFDAGTTEKPEWLEDWCFLAEIDRFFNLNSKDFYTTKVFDSVFGRNMPVDTLLSASEFALHKTQIPAFHNALYLPAEEDTFRFNGKLCVNTYSAVNQPPIPNELTAVDRRNVGLVEAHFAHLFVDDRERELLISWLAYIVQTRMRPNWAIVMQGVEGDGKSLIGTMMGAVLGGDNVRTMQAQTLEAQHNAWATGQLLTFIEEIRLAGHNRHDVLNRIKPLITNDAIEVHPKNINPYNAPNTTAYIAATNFPNALPLTDNDRRYFVLMSQWQTAKALEAFQSARPSYFDDFVAAIDGSPGAIRKWLLDYKLHRDFHPKGRAPYSEGRQYMASLNKSDDEIDLADILEGKTHPLVTEELIVVNELRNLLADDSGLIMGGQAIKTMLTNAGFKFLGRFRTIDGRDSMWTKKGFNWPKNPEKIAQAVRKYILAKSDI